MILVVMMWDTGRRAFAGTRAHPRWDWLVLGSFVYTLAIELAFPRLFAKTRRGEKPDADLVAGIRFAFALSPPLVAFAARAIGADEWVFTLALLVATPVLLLATARGVAQY